MTTVPPAVNRARRRLGWPMPGLPERAWRSPLAFDLAFAMVMGVLTLAGSLAESHPIRSESGGASRPPVAPPAALPAGAAGALALIWRRRRPGLVLVVSLAGVLAYTVPGVFRRRGAAEPRRRRVCRRGGRADRPGGGPLGADDGRADGCRRGVRPAWGRPAAAFVLIPGEVARPRCCWALSRWPAAAPSRAERTLSSRPAAAVDAERLRIARELHDVVAHTMATINVQAGVAGHVIAEHPEQAGARRPGRDQAGQQGGDARAARHPQRPAPGATRKTPLRRRPA